MPRQARLDAPGTSHHVIIRGIEKRKIVDDKVDRDNFVSRMVQVAHETETVIYAWALMTNHITGNHQVYLPKEIQRCWKAGQIRIQLL
jgi:REP element-mobilizing transposase RayT